VFWTGLKRNSINHNLIFDTCTDSTLAKQYAKEGTYLTYP
jgi:hypothetical protein